MGVRIVRCDRDLAFRASSVVFLAVVTPCITNNPEQRRNKNRALATDPKCDVHATVISEGATNNYMAKVCSPVVDEYLSPKTRRNNTPRRVIELPRLLVARERLRTTQSIRIQMVRPSLPAAQAPTLMALKTYRFPSTAFLFCCREL